MIATDHDFAVAEDGQIEHRGLVAEGGRDLALVAEGGVGRAVGVVAKDAVAGLRLIEDDDLAVALDDNGLSDRIVIGRGHAVGAEAGIGDAGAEQAAVFEDFHPRREPTPREVYRPTVATGAPWRVPSTVYPRVLEHWAPGG